MEHNENANYGYLETNKLVEDVEVRILLAYM